MHWCARKRSASVVVPSAHRRTMADTHHTAGGGIRDYTDSEGVEYSALDVASSYFRSGADKVSLGSDAVLIAEEYWNSGGMKPGTTPIERISFM